MWATGRSQRIEEWATHPDNGNMLFDTLKTPYYGPDGKIRGLIGVSRDITAHFESRQALQHSRDLLNQAQHIGHVGCWEWDIRTGYLFWTDEIYRIFGAKPQQ